MRLQFFYSRMKGCILWFCSGILLFTVGCGVRWQHPSKPRSEFQTDLEYCQRDVREFRKELTGRDDPYNEQVLINDCLKRKGWYR